MEPGFWACRPTVSAAETERLLWIFRAGAATRYNSGRYQVLCYQKASGSSCIVSAIEWLMESGFWARRPTVSAAETERLLWIFRVGAATRYNSGRYQILCCQKASGSSCIVSAIEWLMEPGFWACRPTV